MDVDDSAVLFRAPPHAASLGGQTVDRGAYRGLGDVERLRDLFDGAAFSFAFSDYLEQVHLASGDIQFPDPL